MTPSTLLPRSAPGHSTIALGEVARILGVSESTVRRLAAAGHVPVTRTKGGHRRFSRADIERLVRPAQVEPRLRTPAAELEPLPALARILADRGPAMTRAVARSIYEPDARGWLAGSSASSALDRWAADLAEATRTGNRAAVERAAARLLTTAREGGAGLTEVDAFVGRYLAEARRRLSAGEDAARELFGLRRLSAVLRQALLRATERLLAQTRDAA